MDVNPEASCCLLDQQHTAVRDMTVSGGVHMTSKADPDTDMNVPCSVCADVMFYIQTSSAAQAHLCSPSRGMFAPINLIFALYIFAQFTALFPEVKSVLLPFYYFNRFPLAILVATHTWDEPFKPIIQRIYH